MIHLTPLLHELLLRVAVAWLLALLILIVLHARRLR